MTKEEKATYWRQQVDGFQASGLSVKNYCAQEGIAVATLHYWRKCFAEAVKHQPTGTRTEG
ncbi:IS66 family insertion sequence element accessory protein TnpA, partial [Acidithiobacillus concretivorus]|nr:IS66 family insertion sequence element accessory protein TnpB [Acidithiobacillus concretivorus]